MTNIDSPLLGLSQRLPPSNLQAEQALLGALLSNNKAYDRVSEFLSPDHFADPVHARIYQSIVRRVEASQVADPITLRGEFEHSGALDEVGGTAYLAQLLTAMVGIINAGDYGRAIYDAWIRRQLIDIGETVVNLAFSPEPDLDGPKQIETAEQSLFELATHGTSDTKMLVFRDALAAAVRNAELAFRQPGGVSGLSTGLRDLDAKTGGLHPSDLLILAGRPGMGKTALATKIAFGAARSMMAAAREKGPDVVPSSSVAIFSLEMSAEQLATRLLSEESRVSSDRIRRGEIGNRDFDKFVAVSKELQSLPLFIDDTPAITLSALRTRCRRLQRTRGLGLVVIDYLQLMRPSPGVRSESRVLEISMITQGLKALAKELKVPGHGAVAAVARGRKPRGQAAAAVRPSRVRLDRAGRRRGDVRLSRRILPAAARTEADGVRQRGKIPERAGEMAARHGGRAQQGGIAARKTAPRSNRQGGSVL